jgi:hypothetical protein
VESQFLIETDYPLLLALFAQAWFLCILPELDESGSETKRAIRTVARRWRNEEAILEPTCFVCSSKVLLKFQDEIFFREFLLGQWLNYLVNAESSIF